MSTASMSASTAAATRRMIQHARALTAPPGWSLAWSVEMMESATDPNESVGWSDFDALEDAIANFRRLRTGRSRVRARIVARVVGPTAEVRRQS